MKVVGKKRVITFRRIRNPTIGNAQQDRYRNIIANFEGKPSRYIYKPPKTIPVCFPHELEPPHFATAASSPLSQPCLFTKFPIVTGEPPAVETPVPRPGAQ